MSAKGLLEQIYILVAIPEMMVDRGQGVFSMQCSISIPTL